MKKRLYVAPEFDIVDADLNNILIESGGNGKGDQETDTDDAKAWGGEWFNEEYEYDE